MSKFWLYAFVVIVFFVASAVGFWAFGSFSGDEVDESAVEQIEDSATDEVENVEDASIPHLLGCPCCVSA